MKHECTRQHNYPIRYCLRLLHSTLLKVLKSGPPLGCYSVNNSFHYSVREGRFFTALTVISMHFNVVLNCGAITLLNTFELFEHLWTTSTYIHKTALSLMDVLCPKDRQPKPGLEHWAVAHADGYPFGLQRNKNCDTPCTCGTFCLSMNSVAAKKLQTLTSQHIYNQGKRTRGFF